ncbi:class I adenylate cyclase [Ferrimonas gelatinilytica]|uniref:Class I adenylate cyclase n=1 Tax=Ferrimonas gelatinilytica TaxID=1255257 RepID=A0ABP9RVS0_9GAMM
MRDPSADIALSAELNRQRLARAEQQLGRHAELLRKLPLWLHQNRPDQPGYVAGALCGFVSPPLLFPDAADTGPLLGLYTMGSTGSFGQAADSDIDCWLIHPVDTPKGELTRLRTKCDALTAWFERQGLELHLYLVSPDLLHRGQQEGLSLEHSGSAQNWLLLEEFYRSHIHLAGLPLAWWPGAPEDHPELLNLGSLQHLPASEIFGAALWQLFKGLSRPHKAALKVLLLEAYVADYPDLRILRDELWFRLRSGQRGPEIDHYLMLYQRINDYLLRQHDRQRLTLARHCFYLKCALPLSRLESQADWRYPALRRLVANWHYPARLMKDLDNARQWHAGKVQRANRRLDNLMLTSYQKLTGFVTRLKCPPQLKLDEMALLTRKLYARFDAEPAKIPMLNHLWSHSLEEPELTMVSVQGSAHLAPGWYLYRTAPDPHRLFGETALYHGDSRQACLIWAVSNGLVGDNTLVHCHQAGRHWHSKRLTALAQRLQTHWRQPPERALQALAEPWRYTRLSVLCNLEWDPSAQWQGSTRWFNRSPFSVGSPARNLLGSVTLLTENSWGERHCYGFRDPEGVLKLLAQMIAGLSRRHAPITVPVFGAARRHNAWLESHLAALVQHSLHCFAETRAERIPFWPLQLGDQNYGLYFEPQGLRWQRLAQDAEPRQQFQQHGVLLLPQPDLGDDPYSKAPAILRHYVRKGVVQVFVRERVKESDLYLVDAQNRISQLCSPNSELGALIARLNKPTQIGTRENAFDLPQFYRLSPGPDGELRVLPLSL